MDQLSAALANGYTKNCTLDLGRTNRKLMDSNYVRHMYQLKGSIEVIQVGLDIIM